jgi:hypothetical protein
MLGPSLDSIAAPSSEIPGATPASSLRLDSIATTTPEMFRQCNVGVVEGRFSREEGARRPMKGRYEPELATAKPSAVIGADRVLPRLAPEIRSTHP